MRVSLLKKKLDVDANKRTAFRVSRDPYFCIFFSRLALLDPLSTTVDSVAKPQLRMSVQNQQKKHFLNIISLTTVT